MFNTDSFFLASNTIAFLAWLILIALPYKRAVHQVLYGIIVLGMGILYSALFIQFFEPSSFESFSTLDGLMSLFSSKEAVLLGWIHYLAFDMLAGLYIVRDAEKNNLPPYSITICLLFTFMAGPLGWTSYILLRTITKKHYNF